ncbi:MAG TPA: ribosome-associated translation inhibitor RaiA [Thermotogota bacterium]|nr:ribosome-associated translation inhibitor RaiA [Thermotogota bacterium]HPR95562.1 ribosome-associated translation inhibitor RaiA [Thermotogota bacterium]
MDYKLVTRGFTPTEAVNDYVDKKASKLEKVLPEGDHVHGEVKIERENKDFRAEITFHIRGAIIRTEETTSDIYASVDNAVDSMEKKLEKYKNKRMARHRNAKATAEEITAVFGTAEQEDEYDEISKNKRFFLRPMNVEEAKLQLDMLGHSFFVFKNADTDEINLIYKRQNKSMGLIEFEV